MNKPNTTKTASTVKPFKSALAAKSAMTKAERAYVDAMGKAGSIRHQSFSEGWENGEAARQEAKAAMEAARLHAQAVYDQAQAQGFWVKSWYFSHNPTRELILNNMD